jgi:MFS family permease
MGTGIIFFQASIAETRGWNAAVFPTGFIVFAVVRAAFSLVAGSWADRMGSLRLLPLPTSLFALGLLCLVPTPLVFAYVFFAILGVGFGASSGIMTAAWSDLFGAHRIGLIKGISGSVGVFSTAIAPVAFGMAFAAGISLTSLLVTCAVAILVIAWPLSLLLSKQKTPQ